MFSFDSQFRFPMETILGFSAKKSLRSQDERVNYLDDIIRDILILAEADFLVCGFSSNVRS